MVDGIDIYRAAKLLIDRHGQPRVVAPGASFSAAMSASGGH